MQCLSLAIGLILLLSVSIFVLLLADINTIQTSNASLASYSMRRSDIGDITSGSESVRNSRAMYPSKKLGDERRVKLEAPYMRGDGERSKLITEDDDKKRHKIEPTTARSVRKPAERRFDHYQPIIHQDDPLFGHESSRVDFDDDNTIHFEAKPAIPFPTLLSPRADEERVTRFRPFFLNPLTGQLEETLTVKDLNRLHTFPNSERYPPHRSHPLLVPRVIDGYDFTSSQSNGGQRSRLSSYKSESSRGNRPSSDTVRRSVRNRSRYSGSSSKHESSSSPLDRNRPSKTRTSPVSLSEGKISYDYDTDFASTNYKYRPEDNPKCADSAPPNATYCIDDDFYPVETVQTAIDKNFDLLDRVFPETQDSYRLIDGLEEREDEKYTERHYFNNRIYPMPISPPRYSNNSDDSEPTTPMSRVTGNGANADYFRDGGYICPSRVQYVQLRRAQNSAGLWKVILNLRERYKGLEYQQGVRLEVCLRPSMSCSFMPPFYGSQCLQKYSNHRLLAWSHDKGFHMDVFRLPTSCACHFKTSSKNVH